jgi:hypothetical protein
MPHRDFRCHAAGLIVLLASLTACQPAAQVPDAGATAIDASRLLSDVQILASDAYMGRRAGTEGGRMAVDYVEMQMEAMGLAPACEEDLRQSFSFNGREGAVDATNLIALIPGTSRWTGMGDAAAGRGAIVLSAHLDHLGQRGTEVFNGADDNASGTAVLLEIARALKDAPLEHDLILAALDAEEMGLRGARHFVATDCFGALDVRLNINLDMVSRSQAGELYAAGTHHYPFLRPILQSVVTTNDLTLLFGHDEPGLGSDDWTNASDHAPFHAEGIPFVYFGVEDHAGYHNATDDYDDITPEFFVSSAGFILEATRALDGALDGFPQR